MIGQEVKATIPYRDRVLVLAELEVGANSRLVGKHSDSLNLHDGAVRGAAAPVPDTVRKEIRSRLLAVQTLTFESGGGGHLIEPSEGRYLQQRDRVFVIATTAGLHHLREEARARPEPDPAPAPELAGPTAAAVDDH
ncbi:hypothetical protein GCM10027063_21040 [Promicromonospora xylanilytica]